MSEVVLALTSPHMTGSVVRGFQRDANERIKAWGADYQLDVDGDYGMKSRDLAHTLLYGLGVDKTFAGFDGISSADRLKIRYGWDHLTHDEQTRHKARADWRKRAVKRLDGDGLEQAIAFARANVGVTEHPAGSNTGPTVDQWEHACKVHGAPWCGCFLNAVLVHAGFPNDPRRRFCPWIEADAKAGVNGWRWSPGAVVGAAVLYGLREADHVGFVVAASGGVDTETIEGNTSNGPGGSQSNGGIVAVRHRHRDGSLAGFPIRGYAIPPWGKL